MSVWKSELTEEMVSELSGQEVSLLVEALDQAVQEVCENWEVKAGLNGQSTLSCATEIVTGYWSSHSRMDLDSLTGK